MSELKQKPAKKYPCGFVITEKTTPAFLIGSRVYGTPRPDSDLDLVILAEPEVRRALYDFADTEPKGPLRFGNLNIIVATTVEEYRTWGQALLTALDDSRFEPITRDEAVMLFKSVGVNGGYGGKPPLEQS